jgi:hypothetical protein
MDFPEMYFWICTQMSIATHFDRNGSLYLFIKPHIAIMYIVTKEFNDVSGYNTASGIQQAACWVYRRSLLHLPALVRTWWNDSDVRVAGMVERLTAALVSPIVCASEMKAVQDHEKNFSNMAVSSV